VKANAPQSPRVALVHHWLHSYTGAERVLSVLADMYPQADIFVLVANGGMIERFAPHKVKTSFLQRVPGSRRIHRHLLPMYPIALEQFDFSDYDLVISHESGPAKGIITSTQVCHLCYCHSPMRYVWDLYHKYINGNEMSGATRAVFTMVAHYIRMWDLASASRVDYFAASSSNAASRIQKIYRRDARVIYPPVNLVPGYVSEKIDDYYLVIGRLVDYKRVDLAIDACRILGRPLHIVGAGPQYRRLKKLAGPTVTFLGEITDTEVHEQYAHCRALLFAGEEDFGIVPVEAHAFGRPVIAYGRGGALETVQGPFATEGPVDESSDGIFFAEQTVDCLVSAIRFFESVESRFSPHAIARGAQRFSTERFKDEMGAFVADRLRDFR
jgi:glycosyltransferase involved in cell wall biosynthesis